MIAALVVVAVLGLVACVIVMVARDPGPSPSDIAISYEHAWDRLDFDALWALSGDELRDGMDRHAFVVAKKAAYADRAELGHLAELFGIEHTNVGPGVATVRTRVLLRNGDTVCNDLMLTKRGPTWVVTGYRLVSTPPPAV